MNATIADFLIPAPSIEPRPPSRADLDRRALARGMAFRVHLWYHGVEFSAYGRDETDAYLKAFDKSLAPSNIDLDPDDQSPLGHKVATYRLA